MSNDPLDFKNILDVVLKTTKKNANILADSYLIKDASIISKWKRNKTVPKNDDIFRIVDFTINESTATQRKIIRELTETLICKSLLNEDIKNSLLKIEDFQEFLLEVFNVSTSDTHSKSEPDDDEHGRAKGFSQDNETITAFSDPFEGKYSGVLEFDLVLSKDNGQRGKSQVCNPGKNSHNRVNLNIISTISSLQRNLKGKGVLGMTVVGIISALLMFQILNGTQISNPPSDVKDVKVYSVKGELPVNTPEPAETPLPTASQKIVADKSLTAVTSVTPSASAAPAITCDPPRTQDKNKKDSSTADKGQNTRVSREKSAGTNTNRIDDNRGSSIKSINGNDSNIVEGNNIYINIGR